MHQHQLGIHYKKQIFKENHLYFAGVNQISLRLSKHLPLTLFRTIEKSRELGKSPNLIVNELGSSHII